MLTMTKFEDREHWLAGRAGRIGGSEAAAIVGRNPYMTNVELWEIKTGRMSKGSDLDDNPFVVYGRNAEEHLRDLFILDFPQYSVDYCENNLWLNSKYPFAHASLDGWLTDPEGRRGVLEIKTTSILQSMQREKWRDRIPDNYYCQVLHYMMVMEADFAILKAQLKYEYDGEIKLTTRHYKIERKEVQEDITFLEVRERAFFEMVKKGERPPLVLPQI